MKSGQGQMNLYNLQWFYIPNIFILLLKISEIIKQLKSSGLNHDIEVKDIVHMPRGTSKHMVSVYKIQHQVL